MLYLHDLFDVLRTFANRFNPSVAVSLIPQFEHHGDFYSSLLFDLQKFANIPKDTLIKQFLEFSKRYYQIKVLGEGFIVFQTPSLEFRIFDFAKNSQVREGRFRSILSIHKAEEEGVILPRLAYEVALSGSFLPSLLQVELGDKTKLATYYYPRAIMLPVWGEWPRIRRNLVSERPDIRDIMGGKVNNERGASNVKVGDSHRFKLVKFIESFRSASASYTDCKQDFIPSGWDIIFASSRSRERNLLLLDVSKSQKIDLSRPDIADLAIYLSQVTVKSNHPLRDYLQFDNADFDLELTKSRTNLGWFLRFLREKLQRLQWEPDNLSFHPADSYYLLALKGARYVTSLVTYVSGELAFNPRTAAMRLTLVRFEFLEEVCKYLNFARLCSKVTYFIDEVLRFEAELFDVSVQG